MKRKIILFIIVFCFAIIITSPNFVPSHGLDSYCNMFTGYDETAIWFLKKGRVLSALMFWIYGLINIPFDSVGFLSALGINLCLSGAICVVYNYLSKNIENKIVKLSILILSFSMFYMPLMIEVVMFDEAMVMGFGVLMAVLCAKMIADGGWKKYLLAILFMIISVASYQGMACFLIPTLLLFESKKMYFEKNNKKSVLNVIKKIILALIIYGIAFFFDLFIIKLIAFVLGDATSSVNNVNLLQNIRHIFTYLIPTSLKELFGFIYPKVYYVITFVALCLAIFGLIKSDFKLINFLLLIGLILSSVLMPFVSNIVMNSDENYMAARTVLSLTILPSVICLFTIVKFDFDFKFFKYLVLIFGIIIVIIYSYLIYKNCSIDLNRYRQDIAYLSNLQSEISEYENENNIKIKRIYWAKDVDSAYYYSTGYANGANIRVMAEGWAMKCAVNDYINFNKDVTYEEMSEKKYNELFKNKEYNYFDGKQLHFEGNSLYLLVY